MAYRYIHSRTLYPEATKNEKRVIRRKATTLDVVDGVLHYRRMDGGRVRINY